MKFNINISHTLSLFLSCLLYTTSTVIASGLTENTCVKTNALSSRALNQSGLKTTQRNDDVTFTESWKPWESQFSIDYQKIARFAALPECVKRMLWCDGAFVNEFDRQRFNAEIKKLLKC